MSRMLITGANGTIGTRLVAQLRAADIDCATMSSRPGADVQADFHDPASLKRAFDGVDTLFLVFPFFPGKEKMAENAVAAAQAAGVRHIVRSSAIGADAGSELSLPRMQGEIDARITGSGIAWTLLRPAGFMQNWTTYFADQVRSGTYYAPHGDGAQSLIDAQDIAAAAVAVLRDPAAHAGQIYTLTGREALTDEQMCAEISAASGRPLRYVDVPEAAAEKAMQDAGMPPVMVQWLMDLHRIIRQGWGALVTGDVQRLAGRPPRRFAEFARENAAVWRQS